MQVLRRAFRLSGARQCLGRRLLDRGHRLSDLIHARGLLLSGGSHLHIRLRAAFDFAGHLMDHLPGARCQNHALLNALRSFFCDHHCGIGSALNLAQDLAHLNGRRFRAFRQIAHMLRDDGETFALLTGARRLDSGVQRQQIGLIRQFSDGGGNGADRLGLLRQREDRLRNAFDAPADLSHPLIVSSTAFAPWRAI